jgi:hypothetical protein
VINEETRKRGKDLSFPPFLPSSWKREEEITMRKRGREEKTFFLCQAGTSCTTRVLTQGRRDAKKDPIGLSYAPFSAMNRLKNLPLRLGVKLFSSCLTDKKTFFSPILAGIIKKEVLWKI